MFSQYFVSLFPRYLYFSGGNFSRRSKCEKRVRSHERFRCKHTLLCEHTLEQAKPFGCDAKINFTQNKFDFLAQPSLYWIHATNDFSVTSSNFVRNHTFMGIINDYFFFWISNIDWFFERLVIDETYLTTKHHDASNKVIATRDKYSIIHTFLISTNFF